MWFDPRSGGRAPAGKMAATGVHEFDPPSEPGDGSDWVLVLEAVMMDAVTQPAGT